MFTDEWNGIKISMYFFKNHSPTHLSISRIIDKKVSIGKMFTEMFLLSVSTINGLFQFPQENLSNFENLSNVGHSILKNRSDVKDMNKNVEICCWGKTEMKMEHQREYGLNLKRNGFDYIFQI